MSSATQRHIDRIRERLLSTEMVTAGEITFTRYEFALSAVLDFEPHLANLLDTWTARPKATARELLELYQRRNARTLNLFQRFQIVDVSAVDPLQYKFEYVGKDTLRYGRDLDRRKLVDVMPGPVFWKAAADYWRSATSGQPQYSVITHTGFGVFRSYGRLILPSHLDRAKLPATHVLVGVSYIEEPKTPETEAKPSPETALRKWNDASPALEAISEANRDYGEETDWLKVVGSRMERAARMVEIAKELRHSAEAFSGDERERLLRDAAELEKRAVHL